MSGHRPWSTFLIFRNKMFTSLDNNDVRDHISSHLTKILPAYTWCTREHNSRSWVPRNISKFMPDDDWNSGYKKLRCVSLSTGFTVGRPNRSRECFEMENPLFNVIHRSIPWINFNQFGWMHSIVKANIWAIPRNGDDLSDNMAHSQSEC